MNINIEIPDYSSVDGFRYDWCKNFQITTYLKNGVFVLKANKEGLESLAKQLLQLSQDEIPKGFHLHYDEYNSLEDLSLDFIIEKE